MAPEQGRGDEVDHRADLYALGCVVHECLTGHPPFERGDLLATLSAHASEPVPPTGNAALDAFLGRALAKDPAARYGSGVELLAALRDALGGHVTTEVPVPPVPPTLDLPAPVPAPAARRRWPVVAGAALVAFVVAAGLLAFVAAGDDDASAPPSTEAAPTIAAGGTVVLGSAAVIEDLNPHRYLSAEGFVSGNVLPPLYELDEELAWRPFLADGEPEVVIDRAAPRPLPASRRRDVGRRHADHLRRRRAHVGVPARSRVGCTGDAALRARRRPDTGGRHVVHRRAVPTRWATSAPCSASSTP